MGHRGKGEDGDPRNPCETSLAKAAVIRDITEGLVPQKQNITGRIPFNLMKSETLVWVMEDVDYIETIMRRERHGHLPRPERQGRKGPILPAQHFRSRVIEKEETVHQAGLYAFQAA